jgi:hypothetical protein
MQQSDNWNETGNGHKCIQYTELKTLLSQTINIDYMLINRWYPTMKNIGVG